MWDWLDRVFGRGFMPHGHCYLWTPSMVWSQVSSNFLIGLAYASIASTLGVLVHRIRNIPFGWVYVAFGVFILSCGLTHFFDVVTVWHPVYWADAAVRVVTAVASVATAVLILPMVPQAVALAETARLSDERRLKLESALSDLELANAKLAEREQEAQQRAELSDEQFQSLVEAMPQLTWISSPGGRNLYRNARWAEYTGLDLAELRARGWESVHDPALLEMVTERWRSALKSGAVFECECRLRRADGEYRWFIARAVPLRDKAGRITRWIGTCTDIHEHRGSSLR
jgi:PAS domain S-box-containing protein